ncbi:HAD family phosphatase [Candidatus Parcubacteria bacterium]|nr:HAD family phosphatase [Candidatus Parcubacteria bacterium]
MKAILFDMNGVIVDDEALHESAFRQVIADQTGQQLSAEEYRRYFAGKTDRDGFVAYLGANRLDLPVPDLLAQKAKAYRRLASDNLVIYEGVQELVEAAYDRGIQLALVTSSLMVEAETVLRELQLSDYFEVIISAEDITRGKPDPEGYQKALELLGVAPDAAVVIEDAPSGVTAARSAGVKCLAVANTHDAAQLADADWVVGEIGRQTLDLMEAGS